MNNRNLEMDRQIDREMLIAFYRRESPWMVQTLEDLRLGYPFTADNLRVLAALKEAFKLAA